MVAKVNTTPLLPQSPGLPELFALARFDQDLIQALVRELIQYAYRLNLSLPEDGSEAMQNPLPLATFTIASKPAASSWTGAIIYVSDGAANKKLAISDGTVWRYPDGTAV